MSTFLRVFGRKSCDITQAELAQFVREGVYFDEQPSFDPADVSERLSSSWESLRVNYDADKRPITIWRTGPGDLLREDVAEAMEALASTAAPTAPDIAERLSDTRIVYSLEISDAA